MIVDGGSLYALGLSIVKLVLQLDLSMRGSFRTELWSRSIGGRMGHPGGGEDP